MLELSRRHACHARDTLTQCRHILGPDRTRLHGELSRHFPLVW